MDDSIGVFDSGVGGLTVLDALQKVLPNEHFVFLGDTARVPYGNRTPQTIVRYSMECAGELVRRGVKAIVIACNTATAHALDVLRCEFDVPIFGVIEPASREAASSTRNGSIGVIGTRATVSSGAYNRAIHTCAPDIRVVSQACPLFAPIVEEGWADTEMAYLTALEYLRVFADADPVPDTLILGCTHYPILRRAITRALETLGLSMHLCDCSMAAATTLREQLALRGMLSSRLEGGAADFLVTDAPAPFAAIGASFMEHKPRQVCHIEISSL